MKKLFIILAAALLLFGGVGSASAGPSYSLEGTMSNNIVSLMLGYPMGQVTSPPFGMLTFIDGYTPAAGATFDETVVDSYAIYFQDRRVFLSFNPATDTIDGTFSSTDMYNGMPEIDTILWYKPPAMGGTSELTAANEFYAYGNPGGQDMLLTGATFRAQASVQYTGIQITGISTDILSNLSVGDSLQFTINALAEGGATIYYQFFTRAGYGLGTDTVPPNWGGNSWTIVQDWSTTNSVSITFNTPGVYFVAGHLENTPGNWAFGDPQAGIVVEVQE